jgi:LemA protein
VQTSSFIILGIIAVSITYLILIYNNLVRLKHNVAQAWSNIDVILKQRHDELPKLVNVCQEYMGYEKSTLTDIVNARSAVASAQQSQNIRELGQAETRLRVGLGQLFALAESYPDLKANDSFRHLQARISGLEDDIADRRELYNSSVNLNNVRIEQFPDVLVARWFHFGPFDLLEFDEAELQDVNIRQLFNS